VARTDLDGAGGAAKCSEKGGNLRELLKGSCRDRSPSESNAPPGSGRITRHPREVLQEREVPTLEHLSTA
jgi:hypothetical protein